MSMTQDEFKPITPETLERGLRQFYDTEDALQAAVSLLNAVCATEQVLLGENRPEVAAAVGRFLTDFSYGLFGNPFWKNHSAPLTSVFAAVVIARMDSYGHAARRSNQVDNVAHIASRQAVAEIAVQVLFYEQGTKGLNDKGHALRTRVIELTGRLVSNPR